MHESRDGVGRAPVATPASETVAEPSLSRVMFPLRSNAAWFASAEARAEPERRLKMHLLVYDEIVVQDGRYECTIVEGGSYDRMLPPQLVKDRRSIRYMTPGSEFSLLVSATSDGPYHPVLAGPPVAAYEVDCFPIFQEAGLIGAPYIKAFRRDLPE